MEKTHIPLENNCRRQNFLGNMLTIVQHIKTTSFIYYCHFGTFSILSKQSERLLSIDQPVKREGYRGCRSGLQEYCIILACSIFSCKYWSLADGSSIMSLDYGFSTLRMFQESRKIFTRSRYTATEEGGCFLPHTSSSTLSPGVFRCLGLSWGQVLFSHTLRCSLWAPLCPSPEYPAPSFETDCSYLSHIDKKRYMFQSISISPVMVRRKFIEPNNWLG